MVTEVVCFPGRYKKGSHRSSLNSLYVAGSLHYGLSGSATSTSQPPALRLLCCKAWALQLLLLAGKQAGLLLVLLQERERREIGRKIHVLMHLLLIPAAALAAAPSTDGRLAGRLMLVLQLLMVLYT